MKVRLHHAERQCTGLFDGDGLEAPSRIEIAAQLSAGRAHAIRNEHSVVKASLDLLLGNDDRNRGGASLWQSKLQASRETILFATPQKLDLDLVSTWAIDSDRVEVTFAEQRRVVSVQQYIADRRSSIQNWDA